MDTDDVFLFRVFFFFFQPFFPVCVHDNKMAFTGNGMHFQMPGKEEG